MMNDKYFLPYQLRWLKDKSKIKIWEKSRRIGATYVQSFEDVQDCINKKVPAVWFSSADESAAKEYIDYCEQWVNFFTQSLKIGAKLLLIRIKISKLLLLNLKTALKFTHYLQTLKVFVQKAEKLCWMNLHFTIILKNFGKQLAPV
jgi:hypothetical protein